MSRPLFVGLSVVYYGKRRAAEIITAQMCDDILHRIFKNGVQQAELLAALIKGK